MVSMYPLPRPSARTLLALGVVAALIGPGAQSAATPKDIPEGVFRYQLRALGALGGEAVLTIGAERRIGTGSARRVRLEARTAGIAERVYKAEGDGTVIVDQQLRPLRLKWTSTVRGLWRSGDLTFGARSIKGRYRRGENLHQKVDYTTEVWVMDALSAYVQIPQLTLTPQTTTEGPFFDGRWLGKIKTRIGEPASIRVPVGLREVIPVHIVAGRPGREREVTFWIGRADRVLYRVEMVYGLLNVVQADLVGVRR